MKRAAAFALLSLLPLAAPVAAAPRATAHFAGGCFWCEETAFEGRPGVLEVISGFTGGAKDNPSYEEVSSGDTGHFESVEVVYDPSKVSYDQLLEIYWHSVDPLDGGGQFCDRGSQYRSAIFVATATERRAAEASKKRVESELAHPVATQILPAGRFWPAEEYHQDFFRKNPVRYHSYRYGCGRDRRLRSLWGDRAIVDHQ